jgi:hypothetical protein
MSIFGSVQITGFIAPTYSGDTYATHDAYYGRDGLRNVDVESDLDNITALRRKAGMIVGVSGGTQHYRLLPEPWTFTFSDWALAFLTPSQAANAFTGNTSASCITDLWVSNIHGCSPITIHDSIQSVASTNTGLLGISFGTSNINGGDNSLVVGFNNSNTVGHQSIVAGKYNDNSGYNLLMAGRNNYNSGNYVNLVGSYNYVSADNSIIGGTNNSVYSDNSITIGGYNTNYGNSSLVIGNGNVNYTNNAIVAGSNNTNNGPHSTIGGGRYNTISSKSSFIGGGKSNTISRPGSAILGGYLNQVTQTMSVIGGGNTNRVFGTYSGILGGKYNLVDTACNVGFIVGGQYNHINSSFGFIGGGKYNNILSSGIYSSILGGRYNYNIGGFANTHIIGSNIYANKSNFTFVNSLDIYTVPQSGDTATDGILVRATDGEVKIVTSDILSKTLIYAYGIPNTEKLKLEDVNNWTINGSYTGTTITNTYQGQKWYDNDYFFEAVGDNDFIRLPRA